MKKILKVSGILMASIILFFVAALFLFKVFSPSYLIPYVIEKVEQETNGRYTLSVNSDSLKIRFISMTVHLGQTTFKRDINVSEYSGIDFLDKFDVSANLQSFDIDAFNVLRYAFSKKLIVDRINLIKPKIIIKKNRGYRPETIAENQKEEVESENLIDSKADSLLADTLAWSEFKSSSGLVLPHLVVEQFEISEAQFSFYDGNKSFPLHEINGFTFDLKGFELMKQSDFNIEDGSIRIDSVSSLISKNTARLKVQGVELNPTVFHIDSLHFAHIVDKYRINRIKGFRASWLDIGVTDINIVGLHPSRLVSDSTVFIDKVSLGRVYLNLFKDKSDPKINPGYKALPQEIIRNIPSKLEIDTVEISNADLVIDMQASDATRPGQITLNKTNVLITNFTNIQEELDMDPIMKIHISTQIMNRIPLTLDYKLKIDSKEDQFWVQCHADPFDVSILNDFLGSQFFIEFKSGFINNLDFNFEGNNKANVGEMDFEYSNLKIQKLQEQEKYLEGRPKTGFFASVGNILISQNRSSGDKNYKPGVIYYEKEFNRDIIHGTVMSLLSGILSSMGFTNKNLEKQQKKAVALDETSIEKSAETAQKKAEKADQQKEDQEKQELKNEKKEIKGEEKLE